MQRVLVAALAALMIIALTLGVFIYRLSDWTWSTKAVVRSKLIGDTVIVALDAYRRDKGQFPHLLEELVPHYLQTVPAPIAGTGQWRYKCHDDGEDFTLSFGTESWYPCCVYKHSYGSWYTDS